MRKRYAIGTVLLGLLIAMFFIGGCFDIDTNSDPSDPASASEDTVSQTATDNPSQTSSAAQDNTAVSDEGSDSSESTDDTLSGASQTNSTAEDFPDASDESSPPAESSDEGFDTSPSESSVDASNDIPSSEESSVESSDMSSDISSDISQEESAPAQTEEKKYVGSTESDKYHFPSCRHAKNILPENEIWFTSIEEAVAAGYAPCGVCRPPRPNE